MSFDINDETHWMQIEQGIKRHIQFPSKSSQYLIELLRMVRAILAPDQVCASEPEEDDAAPHPFIVDNPVTDEELEELTAPDETDSHSV